MAFGKYAKLFTRPRKLFDKPRIDDENILVKKYGLKNKREIWKAESEIEKIRRRGKELITASQDEQKILINKLQKMGFKIEGISDILALNKEDWLRRRLQSIVFEKKLASTVRGARQLITHKHIAIDKKIINIPSYMVSIDGENKIDVILKSRKEKKREKKPVEEEEAGKKEKKNAETNVKAGENKELTEEEKKTETNKAIEQENKEETK
jgi:ribosomal protein uS4